MQYIPTPPPWLFAISSFQEFIYVGLAGVALYALFFGVGTGLSVAFAFQSCQKVDVDKSLKFGAIWAAYPGIAWYIIRIFAIFRTKFDDVLTTPWLSIGYVLALASLAGIFSLSSSSIQNICVASIDEAQEFRDRLAAQQAAKDAAAKVKAAQETTPGTVAVL